MLDTDVPSTCLSKGEEVSAALAMRDHDERHEGDKGGLCKFGLIQKSMRARSGALTAGSLSLSLANCNACVRFKLSPTPDLGLAMLGPIHVPLDFLVSICHLFGTPYTTGTGRRQTRVGGWASEHMIQHTCVKLCRLSLKVPVQGSRGGY